MMRNELSTEKPAQGRAGHSPTFSRCGGVSAAFAILDTRNGKVYRLFRCASCGNTAWAEEQQGLYVLSTPETVVMDAYFENGKPFVRCECGAEYRRSEPTCLMPHSGHVSCEVCGAVLESWAESTHIATFELVKRPDRKLA